MRLFAAIDLTAEIRQRIAEYIAGLIREVPGTTTQKWVRPESLHLTLKFIGGSDRVDEIKEALRQVQWSSFNITLRNVGFFTPQKPQVFWADVEASSDLQRLASVVDAALANCGVALEKNEYHPHITLARTGSARPHGAKGRRAGSLLGIKKAIEANPALANPHFGTMMPREFFLFRSETLPEGARYSKLEAFPVR